ncbi:hypothetical protein [Martelella mediterranea]|uniref:hypothetical protein n=1 Tax=Martelella mediterranea TaxID=293089 RepID=UPI0003777326|nr:hypothetical protein [Martelella mediterranea]
MKGSASVLNGGDLAAYEEVVPGAFLITCHSGVSLAALHAYESTGWLEEGRIPEQMEPFSLARFSGEG